MSASKLVCVKIQERSFRLIVVGPSENVNDAALRLASLALESNSEDAFLLEAASVLAALGCSIAEIFDLTRASKQPPLVDMLRFAAGRRTATESWAVIRAVLADVDAELLSSLVKDGHLTFAQELIHDVSRDLDGESTSEIAALRADLPSPYDYLLLGP